MAVARHLSSWGAQLDVVLDGDPGRLRGAPAQPWHSLQAFGLTDAPPVGLGAPDRMLDALIGYGVSGSPGREPRRWIEWALSTPAPVLALDTPSGLDVDADDAQPPTIRAATTFTTALPKVGLLLPQARPFVGELYLADVGVPPALYRDLGLQVGVLFAQGSILRHAEANSPRP